MQSLIKRYVLWIAVAMVFTVVYEHFMGRSMYFGDRGLWLIVNSFLFAILNYRGILNVIRKN